MIKENKLQQFTRNGDRTDSVSVRGDRRELAGDDGLNSLVDRASLELAP